MHVSVRIKENSPELVNRATDDLVVFRNLLSNMVKFRTRRPFIVGIHE